MSKTEKQLDKFLRKKPKLSRGGYITKGAVVIGDVTLGAHSSVWYGAGLRGDINRIALQPGLACFALTLKKQCYSRYLNTQETSRERTGWKPVPLYFRNSPGKPPPMRAIIFENLPIFFIICCIWPNLFSIVFSSVTLTPLPLAMRTRRLALRMAGF